MSEPTERRPSPIPVPWPFRPPYDLEPSHPLYSHAQRDREQQAIEQQADVQSRWDVEWDEFDRCYQETRSRQRRAEQTHQRQHDQGHYEPPTDSRGGPPGGHERWRFLGGDYVRDSPDGEWVEARKPEVHPETDIYGFPPGDPFYRPHLRYTPREDDYEDAPRGQAAMQPMDNQPPPHAIGRAGMPPPQFGNMYSGGHSQPVGNTSNSRSGPRPPSPPPMPYRPTDMRGDQGQAGHGYPGPSRSVQQGRYQEPRYPTQPKEASTGHDRPLRGGEGYITLTLGDEDLDIWDWTED